MRETLFAKETLAISEHENDFHQQQTDKSTNLKITHAKSCFLHLLFFFFCSASSSDLTKEDNYCAVVKMVSLSHARFSKILLFSFFLLLKSNMFQDETKKRMVQWCIWLTRLALVCKVVRYRLVQTRQNIKKKQNISQETYLWSRFTNSTSITSRTDQSLHRKR